MENARASSSEISTDSSTNSEFCLKTNVEKCCEELSADEHKERNETHSNLVLDLRNIPPISDANSENDDSLEKLSAVFEQPEDPSPVVEDGLLLQDCEDNETNYDLLERVRSLSEIMVALKDELRREVGLWKKEKEEFQILREKSDAVALQEATAAARAAAAAYAVESPFSNNLGDSLGITSEESLRELTILEYEKKLARYQDEYSLIQAEKRYNTCWKLVANEYKQKLMEVERLCNEELEKVRQNASYLQPLKEMTSHWYLGEENHGDTIQLDSVTQVQEHKFHNEETIKNSYHNFQQIEPEINMTPEIFPARFKTEELFMQDRDYGQLRTYK